MLKTNEGRVMRKFTLLLLLSFLIPLSGCGKGALELRHETAKRLATPAFMYERQINAEPFKLTVFDRIRNEGGNATIYIEGDGLAWLSRRTPSLNPTPMNPVALHLATQDKSPNVIYMARPCQYSGTTNGNACPMEYWMGRRFAPEVISSMNRTIDYMKREHNLNQINLVGFSGGGGVAVLIAAQRDDVASIRTVAGNLDHNAFTSYHDLTPMSGSINPADAARKISSIPQHHFTGEWDEIVVPSVYLGYRRAAGETSCIRQTTLSEVDHMNGWVKLWPSLLQEPLDCSN